MNVLFITHYSGLGGANRSLLDLLDAYNELPITAYVVLPGNGPVIDELNKRNIVYIKTHYFNWVQKIEGNIFKKILASFFKDFFNYIATKKIVYFAKKKKIDIIHTNDSLTIVGIKASLQLNIKHVWHIREFLDDDYGFEFRYSSEKVYKYLNKSDRVIAISKKIYDQYIEKIDPEKYILIYNGVQLPEAYNDIKYSVFTIAFAGGSNEGKGIWDVLHAAKYIKAHYDFEFQFLIAGSFNNSMMLDYIEKNNLSNDITIIGNVTNWHELRRKCHIYLVCSLNEAFGRVTVEAMLDRLPVIGANCGATPELICNNQTGLLYEYGNFSELAKKIVYLYNDKEAARLLSCNAYEKAKNNYLIGKTAKCIYYEYRKLII